MATRPSSHIEIIIFLVGFDLVAHVDERFYHVDKAFFDRSARLPPLRLALGRLVAHTDSVCVTVAGWSRQTPNTHLFQTLTTGSESIVALLVEALSVGGDYVLDALHLHDAGTRARVLCLHVSAPTD